MKKFEIVGCKLWVVGCSTDAGLFGNRRPTTYNQLSIGPVHVKDEESVKEELK